LMLEIAEMIETVLSNVEKRTGHCRCPRTRKCQDEGISAVRLLIMKLRNNSFYNKK
jgi:hypothetical protein